MLKEHFTGIKVWFLLNNVFGVSEQEILELIYVANRRIALCEYETCTTGCNGVVFECTLGGVVLCLRKGRKDFSNLDNHKCY